MKCICSALKRNSDRNGFTLVELIVVIAILAILSAVAYPVYTGYITKANEAADQTLLGAVNEAFVSALYDEGYYDGLPPVKFKLGEDEVNIGTDGVIRLTDKLLPDLTDNDSFNKTFGKYFENNEETKFKVFESLIYDPATGGFGGTYDNIKVLGNGQRMKIKDNKDGSHTYTVTDKDGKTYSYTLQDDDVDTFNNSTFGQNMEMSSLMSEVDNVVQALKDFMTSSGSADQLEALLGSEYLATVGVTRENYPDPDDYLAALTNAVVMNVAEASAGLTGHDLIENTDKFQQLQSDNMLAMLAAMYGTATGYANSELAKDSKIVVDGKEMTVKEYYDQQSKALHEPGGNATAKAIGILTMCQNMEKSEKFAEYQSSGAYENDLDGYFAALNALAENKDTLVSQGAMDSGFADEDLGAILDGLFGGN